MKAQPLVLATLLLALHTAPAADKGAKGKAAPAFRNNASATTPASPLKPDDTTALQPDLPVPSPKIDESTIAPLANPEAPGSPTMTVPGANPSPAAGALAKPDPALDLLPMAPEGTNTTPAEPLFPDPTGPLRSPKPAPGAPADQAKSKKRAATAPGKSKTELAEQDLALHIRFRQAYTAALNDPSLHGEMKLADASLTFQERRQHLEAYYNQFFAHILKGDPTLKTLVDERKALVMNRIKQRGLVPSDPLDRNEAGRAGFVSVTPDARF